MRPSRTGRPRRFQRTGFPEMFPLERLSADFYYDSGAEPLPGRDTRPDGALRRQDARMDAPAGEWTVIRYGWTCTGAHTSTSSGWAGLSLDHPNPRRLRCVPRACAATAGRDCAGRGNSVKFLLTDKWEMGSSTGRTVFPKSSEIPGYDLGLPAGDDRPCRRQPRGVEPFSQDIRRTVSDCILNYHYKPFREFANANGMLIDPEAGGPVTRRSTLWRGHGRMRYSPR